MPSATRVAWEGRFAPASAVRAASRAAHRLADFLLGSGAYAHQFEKLILGLIVFSVASIGLEAIPGLPDWTTRVLAIAEIVVVVVFSFEYPDATCRRCAIAFAARSWRTCCAICGCTVSWPCAPRESCCCARAGCAPPLDAETRDRLAELAHLERAIGKSGVLAVRPLMMATGKEIWQLTLLKP